MRFQTPKSMLLSFSILSVLPMALLPALVRAEVACTGHKLLPNPRSESSCSNAKPVIYASPDGALRGVVLPVDVSLYATPDMESRVVIRTSKGDTLTSKYYSSPRGTNGYYVVMQNGRPTHSSLSTACRRRAVIRPGHFHWWCTAARRIASPHSAT